MKKLPVLCSLILLSSLAGGTVAGCAGPAEVTAEWYADQAHELSEQGRYDEAIEAGNKAIELDPNLAMAYIHRADAYIKQGKKAEAIGDLEVFITLTDNPEWIEIARQEIEALQGQ